MEAAPLPTPVNSIDLADPEPPTGTPSPEGDACTNPFIAYHPGADRDTNPTSQLKIQIKIRMQQFESEMHSSWFEIN